MDRRNFLIGSLATLFAAPAIVRCGSLMPIKPCLEWNVFNQARWAAEQESLIAISLGYTITRKAIDETLYGLHWIEPYKQQPNQWTELFSKDDR